MGSKYHRPAKAVWTLGTPHRASSLYELIAKNPQIRKASDLLRDEMVPIREQCAGRVEAMAETLEVSEQALRRLDRFAILHFGKEVTSMRIKTNIKAGPEMVVGDPGGGGG